MNERLQNRGEATWARNARQPNVGLTALLGVSSMDDELTAEALERCFISPNVADSNGEPANLVDVVQALASRVGSVAKAITPAVAGGCDATGGHVESLTEAVMGVSAGMVQIANAIESLADAVRDRG